MPMLNCYVDDETMLRLMAASVRLDRPVDELAESAIAEMALRDSLDNRAELPA